MSCFKEYCRYYDLIYRDRDYAGEAQELCRQLERFAPNARSLLELGCGTGRLARELVLRGYVLHGIDLSDAMISEAERLNVGLPAEQAERLSFSQDDARVVRLAANFDAVFSLFHVMSYQQTNEDLNAALAAAASHLQPGGVFVFDFWYGPAVLSQRPEVRVKRCEDDDVRVVRIAEPVMHTDQNLVEVRYQMLVVDKRTRVTAVIAETHTMRYLFQPELRVHLDAAGFEVVETMAWPGGGAPDENSWGVACVARRV